MVKLTEIAGIGAHPLEIISAGSTFARPHDADGPNPYISQNGSSSFDSGYLFGNRRARMVVVGLYHVESFLREHAECRQELSELVRELEAANIPSPNVLAAHYPSAKILDGKTVVFKVRGNKFRLSARVAYNTQIFLILAVETHSAYDRRHLR